MPTNSCHVQDIVEFSLDLGGILKLCNLFRGLRFGERIRFPVSLSLESETSISAVTPFSDDQAVAYREYVMMSKEGGTVSENSRETNNHIQKQVGMGENLGLQSLSKLPSGISSV